jgi:hypothetical protein
LRSVGEDVVTPVYLLGIAMVIDGHFRLVSPMTNDDRTIAHIKRLLVSLEIGGRTITDLQWRNGRIFVTLATSPNDLSKPTTRSS